MWLVAGGSARRHDLHLIQARFLCRWIRLRGGSGSSQPCVRRDHGRLVPDPADRASRRRPDRRLRQRPARLRDRRSRCFLHLTIREPRRFGRPGGRDPGGSPLGDLGGTLQRFGLQCCFAGMRRTRPVDGKRRQTGATYLASTLMPTTILTAPREDCHRRLHVGDRVITDRSQAAGRQARATGRQIDAAEDPPPRLYGARLSGLGSTSPSPLSPCGLSPYPALPQRFPATQMVEGERGRAAGGRGVRRLAIHPCSISAFLASALVGDFLFG